MFGAIIEEVDGDGHCVLTAVESDVRKQVLYSVIFDFPQVLVHSFVGVIVLYRFIDLI